MNALTRTARREAARLLAKPRLVVLILVWPVFYGFFLASIYSARVVTEMPAAVCDEDNSALSRTALRYIDATRSLEIRYRAPDAEALKAYILSGKAEAAVVIPRGFSSDIKRGKTGDITAFVDGANLLVANIALSELKTVAGTMAAGARIKFLRKTGNSGAKALAAYSPVKIETFKLFNPGGNYMNYLLPGVWGTILQQLLLAFASLLLVGEKDDGTMGDAAAAAGNSPAVLMAGKLLPYFLLFLVIFEIFALLIFPAFSIPIQGSLAAMAALNALFIYATLGLGLFISSVCKESMDAMKGVLLVGAPALLLSGYIWPISYMPAPIRPAALVIPLTHYLAALRKITQYGAGLPSVLPQISALLFTGTAALAAAYLILKRRLARHA